MQWFAKGGVASLCVAFVVGCSEAPPTAAGPDVAPQAVSLGGLELARAEVDLSAAEDLRTLIPVHLVTPEAASDIGTGSAILITIPDEGRFGCTANFVWQAKGRRYLGAAGHCFLPGDRTATHGESPDYDASGVTVDVCVSGCEGNFRTNRITGTWVRLGSIAYARQADPTGAEQVGYDFGIVEIPREFRDYVRLEMPVWGGPNGVTTLEPGSTGCHYGHGVGVGEVFLTKARVGLGGGGDAMFWMGDFAAAFGDSGSGMNGCESDGLGFHGTGAVGVVTHIGVTVCPCDVDVENQKFTAQQGVTFGTTIGRAIEMAEEAGLKISLARRA